MRRSFRADFFAEDDVFAFEVFEFLDVVFVVVV